LAATTTVLGLVAHWRILEVIPLYLSQGFSRGPLPFRDVSLSEVFGLTPFIGGGDREGGWDLLALLVAAAVFSPALIYGNRLTGRRGLFLPILLALAVTAVLLRFVTPYAYGYFKLLSLTAFLFPAGAAAGLATLWHATSNLRSIPVIARA